MKVPSTLPQPYVGHIPSNPSNSVYLLDRENKALYDKIKFQKGGLFFYSIPAECDAKEYAEAMLVMVKAGTMPYAPNPEIMINYSPFQWIVFNGNKELVMSISEEEFNQNFFYGRQKSV